MHEAQLEMPASPTLQGGFDSGSFDRIRSKSAPSSFCSFLLCSSRSNRGKVVVPTTADFLFTLLQAQSSGAKVTAIANVSPDAVDEARDARLQEHGWLDRHALGLLLVAAKIDDTLFGPRQYARSAAPPGYVLVLGQGTLPKARLVGLLCAARIPAAKVSAAQVLLGCDRAREEMHPAYLGARIRRTVALAAAMRFS
jgi:hypothetical protein